jgi:hypothetical protein
VSVAPDFEPYLALRRLETGPTSDVYLARHSALDRLAWIKVLRPHVPLSSPFAARLEREGQLLARLSHPNVVNIIDCVKRPPRLWLVLEAVDGWNLSEVLAVLQRSSNSPWLETRGAVALALQIARGLAHTHAAGVVHGAIRPKHLLISKEGLCKLSGFSLASAVENRRESEDPETEPGAFEPEYLSPEQVLGEVLDERSDLFSLGVVLYELLSGRRPFESSGDGSASQRIRHQPVEPLRQTNPEVSPELERIVQRCLEKQRERRFDSAAQLARALEHVLGSQALADLGPMLALALGTAGLEVPSTAPGPRTRADDLRRREAERGLRQSLGLLFAVSGSMLLGGTLLYGYNQAQRPKPPSVASLPLSTERGQLLVVAEPWAHVFVDGQKLETTPFALPLQLAPGTHHVRLEHPAAPAERRQIELVAGQRIVLEVSMKVAGFGADAGTEPSPLADAGAPSP